MLKVCTLVIACPEGLTLAGFAVVGLGRMGLDEQELQVLSQFSHTLVGAVGGVATTRGACIGATVRADVLRGRHLLRLPEVMQRIPQDDVLQYLAAVV